MQTSSTRSQAEHARTAWTTSKTNTADKTTCRVALRSSYHTSEFSVPHSSSGSCSLPPPHTIRDCDRMARRGIHVCTVAYDDSKGRVQ
eukprot:6504048-Prymnesium_polylepis.3